MKNDEDWENIKKTLFPPVENVVSDARFEYLQKMHDRGDTLNFLTVDGFFWFPRNLFGIEDHLYSFYDYPELYCEICEIYSDWLIELFRYVFSRFKFDFMSFAEDMSYNLGPMISGHTRDTRIRYSRVCRFGRRYYNGGRLVCKGWRRRNVSS